MRDYLIIGSGFYLPQLQGWRCAGPRRVRADEARPGHAKGGT